jgi:UDP-N-acetylmuramoyl-tripeptide--D-alanyl-D-alanine ligase
MIKFSLSDITQELMLPAPTKEVVFEGISHNTRTIKPNNLYVAILGENFDGHTFIQEAYKKGASAALVNRPIDSAIPQLIVSDALETLGKISAFWRNQFTLPVIGVTGSNGKTTLKNMIASILCATCEEPSEVLATEGNLNNNIGLPLMLARLSHEHRFAVLEMGMNHFGEIAYLTQLVKPTVAVITNAAESHLEGVGHDVKGVARAKGEIFEGLQSNGVAVLNRDDPHFDYWKTLVRQQGLISFGLDQPADISAKLFPTHFSLQTPQGDIDITLPLLGIHNIRNALAASAVALAINIDLKAIKKGLENVAPAAGRMRQYLLPNGTRLIDDTYNANPFSTKAAAQTLKNFNGTKIMVLGDMKELGQHSEALHSMTGKQIKEAGIHHLLTLGQLSRATADAFGMGAHHFTDRENLLTALKPLLQEDVTLLIKGSRSMKMEYFVEELVPHELLENTH